MKKILLTMLILALMACPAMGARYRQHQLWIVDEFGDAVTNIDQIEILDVGTSTTSTIYPTRAGGSMTNPITTATTGSTFVQSLGLVSWFQAAPGYKVTVTESGASQSLTIDNQAEGDTRFPFYANYIGTAASLTVGDDQLLNIGTSADFLHDWDNNNTRYVIYPSGDGGRMDFGKAAVHTDIYFHAGDITTDYVFFDEGSLQMSFVDIDLLIDDEAKLLIGDSGDVTIEYDEGNNDLDVLSTSALDEIAFGATGDGYDIKWWSTTTGDYALFDYSADALLLEDLTLALGDGELLLFGDAIGTGTMSLSVATAKLSLLQVAADTGTFDIGVAGTDVPTTWHGETSGAEVTFTGDTVIVDGIDMTFNDGDFLKFGDDFDFTITSASTKNLTIAPLAASDDYIVSLGSDQSGVHLKAFAATTGEYMYWDATNDLLDVIGNKVTLLSTSTSAAGIDIEVDGGASSTLHLHADTGTAQNSIDLVSDVGGTKVTASALPDGQYGLEVSSAIAGGTASQGSAIYAHTTLTGNIDAPTYNVGSWLDITDGTPTSSALLVGLEAGIYVSATPTLTAADVVVLQLQYQGNSSSTTDIAAMIRVNSLLSGSGGEAPDYFIWAGNDEAISFTADAATGATKVGAIKINSAQSGTMYIWTYDSTGT